MVDSTRLWLPAQVCNFSVDEVSLALVGWVNVGPKSLDVVVAAACPVTQLSNSTIRQLQEVLDAAETKLPLTLRIERKLCVIGQYFICPDDQSSSPNDNQAGNVDFPGAERSGKHRRTEEGYPETLEETGSSMKLSGVGSGRRTSQTGEHDRKFDSMMNIWAVILARKSSTKRNGLKWIPHLRSISAGGCQLSVKYHIVIYQQSVFGSHHFSCSPWTPSYELSSQKSFRQKQETSIKKPHWLTDVEHKEAADMDMIMMELNCATYVDEILKDLCRPAGFCEEHSTMTSTFFDYLWSTIAAVMALWAAILYALAQALALILAVWLPAIPFLGSLLQRSMTWQAMHVRCQQLMAWPFIMLWGGLGYISQPYNDMLVF